MSKASFLVIALSLSLASTLGASISYGETRDERLAQVLKIARKWTWQASRNPEAQKNHYYFEDLKKLKLVFGRSVKLIVDGPNGYCGPSGVDALAYIEPHEVYDLADTPFAQVHLCEGTLRFSHERIAEIVIHEMFHVTDHLQLVQFYRDDSRFRANPQELPTTRREILTAFYAGEVPDWSAYFVYFKFDFNAYSKLSFAEQRKSPFYFVSQIGLQNKLQYDQWAWSAILSQAISMSTIHSFYQKEVTTSGLPYLIQVLNTGDLRGMTPLMYAAREGTSDAIQWMLGLGGIQKELKNKNGKTAAEIAVENGHFEASNLLK